MKITMKIIGAIEKFVHAVSIFDGILILALMLMITVDIVMRMFGSSVTGSVEIATMIVPVIVFFGVGYTALKEMHIRVDIFKRWPHMDRVTNLICIAGIAAIGFYCVRQTVQIYSIGTSSTILRIPRWPFVMTTAFGMFMVTIAMILNEVKAYIKIFQTFKEKRTLLSPAAEIELAAPQTILQKQEEAE